MKTEELNNKEEDSILEQGRERDFDMEEKAKEEGNYEN